MELRFVLDGQSEAPLRYISQYYRFGGYLPAIGKSLELVHRMLERSSGQASANLSRLLTEDERMPIKKFRKETDIKIPEDENVGRIVARYTSDDGQDAEEYVGDHAQIIRMRGTFRTSRETSFDYIRGRLNLVSYEDAIIASLNLVYVWAVTDDERVKDITDPTSLTDAEDDAQTFIADLEYAEEVMQVFLRDFKSEKKSG